MKTWKKITIAIIALIVAGFGIFAWANSVRNDKKADTSKKTLIIGLEGTYAPYSYRKDGKLTGFEVELGKAVAKEMGMKAKFVPTKWDSLVAGLGTGKFDLIMNDMTPTPERAKHYDYSIPYIKSRSILIVPASSKIKEIKEVKGKRIVAGIGTENAAIAKKYGATVVPNGDFSTAIGMVRDGRVDGEVNSSGAWYTYRKKNNTKGLKAIDISKDVKPDDISALFNKKDTKLRASYNKAMQKLLDNGTVAKLSKKYFGADLTK
ncbi:transporter substrate-binding domain-containing protein [Lactobacillus rodentium]|uniref:Amino acid ABC transporter substrate-binding protein n=1 Tax=Lactobacillus rodentium TaxID=947835 RepID=A0A2Z6TCL8_9LACO|nr:transporter substrate-binding domain-containing protein [Lactobacillus rodentium]MCR1894229.1 transporter substrate-binding domain-containing protein [Lactobacillus rodentium]GBG04525.1 amino acid ABC transporter substrate-binding protein [Lactobacillus rodentium]